MSKVVSVDVFHRFRIRSKELKNPDLNLKRFSQSEPPHRRVKMSFDFARNKRRSNLVKMLIILVVVFQLCYIPLGILMIMREFGDFSDSLTFMYVDMVALILYYLKYVLNPLIIFTSSSDFKTRLRKFSGKRIVRSRHMLTTVRNDKKETPVTPNDNFEKMDGVEMDLINIER